MNHKMKTILSFIDWYLPGYRAGGTIKAFANQISHLEGIYHFKIVTRDTDYTETDPYEGIVSNKWIKYSSNSEVMYLSSDAVNYKYLKRVFRETKFDALYVHGIYSLWFSIMPVFMAKRIKASQLVVCAHGMLGQHALTVKNTKKQWFLKLARLMGLYRNVVFHAANEAEAQDVRAAIGNKAKVIIAEELPMKADLSDWEKAKKEPGSLRVCSIARISSEKNTKYALEVLNNCLNADIQFDLYGPIYDEAYWQECKKLIAQMPPNIRAEYKGSVPGDEVFDKLQQYHLLLLPTTGENFGHIILESLMAARPVVISTNTPWKYLADKKSGFDLPLKDPAGFTKVLTRFSEMRQPEYDAFCLGAIEQAREFVSNNDILQQNIKLFQDEAEN